MAFDTPVALSYQRQSALNRKSFLVHQKNKYRFCGWTSQMYFSLSHSCMQWEISGGSKYKYIVDFDQWKISFNRCGWSHLVNVICSHFNLPLLLFNSMFSVNINVCNKINLNCNVIVESITQIYIWQYMSRDVTHSVTGMGHSWDRGDIPVTCPSAFHFPTSPLMHATMHQLAAPLH